VWSYTHHSSNKSKLSIFDISHSGHHWVFHLKDIEKER
jgi:hypothetical protein